MQSTINKTTQSKIVNASDKSILTAKQKFECYKGGHKNIINVNE